MGKRVPVRAKREFADLLRTWRERKRLSQSEAARLLEVPVRTLQNWEIARVMPHPYAHAAILRVISRK